MERRGIVGTATPAVARGDEGAVAVIVALVIVALVGSAALAVDVGSLYAERRKLQTAADAGALAGVQELPNNVAGAISTAQSYVALNAPEATQVNAWVTSDLAANDTIRVTITTPNSPHFFARVWGSQSSPVMAASAARITSPVAFGRGVMPIGVVATGTADPLDAFGYTYGTQVRLKRPGGTGETGNYDFVALGGPYGDSWGLSDLRTVINMGGSSFPVYIDQACNTSTGNKVPATGALASWVGSDSHSFSEICPPPDENGVVNVNESLDGAGGCHRVILVPIVIHTDPTCTDPNHPYDWPTGSSTPMKIIGFAQFFVTATGSQGQDAYVDGIFIQTVPPGVALTAPYGSSGGVHYALVQ